MRPRKYIIDDKGRVVPEPDIYKWGKFFEQRDKRIVKQEQVGDFWISTVFLGLDHRWKIDGPPVLWETMAFGKNRNEEDMERCSGTREQAEAMHERMVKKYERLETRNQKG